MSEPGLTAEQRADLVDYFFERAQESLEEAKYLRDGGYYNGAITRLYYACFNASRGLLTANGIDASTHHGVKTMMSMEFIRKGLLGIEHGVTLNESDSIADCATQKQFHRKSCNLATLVFNGLLLSELNQWQPAVLLAISCHFLQIFAILRSLSSFHQAYYQQDV